jgi:hypothetical protein
MWKAKLQNSTGRREVGRPGIRWKENSQSSEQNYSSNFYYRSGITYTFTFLYIWPLEHRDGQSSWLLNGDILCFLWGTNWIYICYVEKSRPPLCSSGQSSWLQMQKSGFDSRRYQIFWEVVSLQRGPLSLVSTTEELRSRNLRIRPVGSVTLTTWHPLSSKVSRTSLTNGVRSVGIVRLQTKATEFSFF